MAPTKLGEAQATAQWLFIPHDPQGRAQVTLDLKLNMAATQASPDPINAQHAGAFSYAGYSVLVCGIGSGPGYVTYDESGTLTNVGTPDCGLAYYNFVAETKGYAGGTWRRHFQNLAAQCGRWKGRARTCRMLSTSASM